MRLSLAAVQRITDDAVDSVVTGVDLVLLSEFGPRGKLTDTQSLVLEQQLRAILRPVIERLEVPRNA